MPRTVGASLEAHLNEEVTTLATCIKIVRHDGVEFTFTEHDVDIVFGGDTYLASAGYDRTAIETDASLAADNFEVTGLIDNVTLLATELKAGVFDYADVYIFLINWADTAQGIMKIKRGNLGEVSFLRGDIFKAEISGRTKALQQVVGELYSPECRASIGDLRCGIAIDPDEDLRSTAYVLGDFIKVPTAAGPTYSQYENRIYECTTAGTTDAVRPSYDTTVGNTTTDGTAVFTAREAWQRHATIASFTDRRNFVLSGLVEPRAVDNWFKYGAIAIESGDNTGSIIQVKSWLNSTQAIEMLFAAPFDIVGGEAVRLYPGCDNRPDTCINNFDNIVRYRGERFVPGPDWLVRFPNAV